MVSGVPFLFLILNVWSGQVSMKDGKILNFHKFSLAWSNIWCYNLKQQYNKISYTVVTFASNLIKCRLLLL